MERAVARLSRFIRTTSPASDICSRMQSLSGCSFASQAYICIWVYCKLESAVWTAFFFHVCALLSFGANHIFLEHGRWQQRHTNENSTTATFETSKVRFICGYATHRQFNPCIFTLIIDFNLAYCLDHNHSLWWTVPNGKSNYFYIHLMRFHVMDGLMFFCLLSSLRSSSIVSLTSTWHRHASLHYINTRAWCVAFMCYVLVVACQLPFQFRCHLLFRRHTTCTVNNITLETSWTTISIRFFLLLLMSTLVLYILFINRSFR